MATSKFQGTAINSGTPTNFTGLLYGDGSNVGSKALDAAPTENSTGIPSSGGTYNAIAQLVQESVFQIVEENGEFKLYWYGAAGTCPYTIVYENGVYNLYFQYTTV